MTWQVVPGKAAAFTQVQLPPASLEGVIHQRNDRVVVIKHTHEAWELLRSRGLQLPHPIAHYDWPGQWEPRDNQRTTAEFLATHQRCTCLNGMRTGKTLSALWAADYLRRQGAVRRVLIVAPLSTMESVWERNLFMHFGRERATILSGTRDKKQATAKDVAIQYLVVNPDSLHLIADHLVDVDLIIADEATAFKNPKARRWKAMQAALKATGARLWLLTASPTAQSPMDAYGLVKLLHDRPPSMGQWRDMTMYQVSRFRWLPKPDAERTVAAWLQPAIRFTLNDCGDVPDVQYEEVPAERTPAQKELVAQLRKAAQAQLGESGNTITAANAAAILSKVLQVESGGVYAHDQAGERVSHTVDAKPFFDAIVEFVQEADTPVLVFAPFRAAVEAIHQALEKAGLRAGKVMGETPRGERTAYFNAVQNAELDALVAIPATMSHGVTLNRASYVLWCAPTFKAEEYEQANGRVLEAASSKKIVVAHIVTSKLASELYSRLKSKAKLQDAVLKLLTGE